jgi:hypothetical protein
MACNPDHFNKVNAARKAIISHCNNQRSVAGEIKPCPVCKQGKLHYIRAFNGHVHAQGTQAGCVAWME